MKVDRVVLNALVPHVRDGFAAGYLRLRRLVRHRLRRTRSTTARGARGARRLRVRSFDTLTVCDSECAD